MADTFKFLTPAVANGLTEAFLGVRRADGLSSACFVYPLHQKLSQVTSVTQGFMTSATLAQRLKHPNLLPVHDVGSFEGRPAVIGEHFLGVDLKTLHRKCGETQIPLSPPMAVYVATELVNALAHLHAAKVTVGAVLPPTVIVSIDGEVRFAGHALAGGLAPALKTFPEDAVVDSRRYLAPEFIESGKATPASDLFSTGILLWELLVSRKFTGEPLDAAEFPVWLRSIVARMMAAKADQRPADAGSVAKELAAFLNESYPTFTPRHLGTFVANLFANDLNATTEELRTALARKDLWASEGAKVPEGESATTFKRGKTLEMDVASDAPELKEKHELRGGKRWDEIVTPTDAPAAPAAKAPPAQAARPRHVAPRPEQPASSPVIPMLLAVGTIAAVILFWLLRRK